MLCKQAKQCSQMGSMATGNIYKTYNTILTTL